jgi:hypothetical protein
MNVHNKLDRSYGGPFEPSLMFIGKARSLPKSGEPKMCFARAGSGLIHKHLTRLESPNKDKYSSYS